MWVESMSCVLKQGRCSVGNARRLYPSQLVCDQNQHKQQNGKADTKRERLYGTVAAPLIPHQEHQSRSETANDEGEGNANQNFHNEFRRQSPAHRQDRRL